MFKVKLRRLLGAFFLKANLTTTLLMLAGYALSSYALMLIARETELTHPTNFLYWLIVTSSTVGYGDLSPVTPLGKWLVSLWVIPLGLTMFAIILAKVGFYLSELILKGKRGLRMLQNVNHTIIIGWNDSRTLRLIDLLRAKTDDAQQDIVLCVSKEMENPLPGQIDFVKTEHFSHEEGMRRTNLRQAKRIIIDTPQDDVTLTTALFCQKHNHEAHITAYFNDETVSDLLKTHCPSVECVPSVGVEMLAKSAVDPGSSALHKQLLDSTYGMTQYSVKYEGEDITLNDVFARFKNDFKATIIAIKQKESNRIDLNPALDYPLVKGDTLFYIASDRLPPQKCFANL